VENATFAPRQRDRLRHVQVRHGVANLSRRRRPVEHHIVWQRGRSPPAKRVGNTWRAVQAFHLCEPARSSDPWSRR
jgi:hypothetical protein